MKTMYLCLSTLAVLTLFCSSLYPIDQPIKKSRRQRNQEQKLSIDPESLDSPENEALFIRRLLKLWKENEYDIAKNQAKIFLERFPHSAQRDYFYTMLGNAALIEQNFPEALAAFEMIVDKDMKEGVRLKRWQALYQLKHYSSLYQELSIALPYVSAGEKEEASFLFAESAFREALTLAQYAQGEEASDALVYEALPYYENLLSHKKLGHHAKLAIGEIYRFLGKYEEAAERYLEIAQTEPDNEEVLFHAAMMLSRFNEKEATETFRRITIKGGKHYKEAAYHWMQLLARQKSWKPLLLERDLFLSALPSNRLPIFHFYTGMVLYEENGFKEAILPLMTSLDQGLLYPHDKSALFALLICAKERKDLTLVENSFSSIQARYPEEIGEAALIRFLAYKSVQDREKAALLIDEVIAGRYTEAILERALREKVHLLVEDKQWQEAYAALQIYNAHFTPTEEIMRLAIDLSLSLVDKEKGYSTLAENIEKALDAGFLSEDELPAQQILLAKAYIKLEKYADALPLLQKYERSEESEVHSLLTLCNLKMGCCPEEIIRHGERALILNPFLPEKDRLHLHLFNAYLDLAKEKNDPQSTSAAEEHLYQIIHTFPVSLENRLWLAHRFTKNEKNKERAIEIFEQLLDTPAQILRFPRESLMLASLYVEKEEHQRASALLEKLAANLDPATSFAEQVQLALACSYKCQGELFQSSLMFQKLEKAQESEVALKATLQLARLSYELLPQEAEQEKIEPILKKLRDLWIKKCILTEPIHLEAAIDFIDFQLPYLTKDELSALFQEIKDHFTLENDIWSKDYHETRGRLPEKDLVFEAYMRYIDARIYMLKAQKSLAERNANETEKNRGAARALFSTLSQGKYAVSKYLSEKAKEEMFLH
ncbi:MAG: tetratricopeptide repeat protein [Chlamydiales bacterium]